MLYIRRNLNANASKQMYQMNVDYFAILAIHKWYTQKSCDNFKNTFHRVLSNFFILEDNDKQMIFYKVKIINSV